MAIARSTSRPAARPFHNSARLRSIAAWRWPMREADLIGCIGTVATVLAIVSLVPQVVRTWRTRSAMDLSGSWLTIAAVSMVLWIAYGTLLTAWSIVVANATTL